MKKYYIISPGSPTSKQMLRDLQEYRAENFEFIEKPVICNHKITENLLKLYFRINAKINLPFKGIWHRCFAVSKINIEQNENYIILGNGNFNYYDSKWLNKLKKKYNVHYIIYYIDPISGLMSKYMENNIKELDSDYVFTFDYEDSKKINAIHTMNLYSKKNIEITDEVIKNSVYFVGMNKKRRADIVHQIWKRLIKNNISCDFNLVGVDEQEQIDNRINYNNMKTYDDVLSDLQRYECILEVLQPGQTGVTLRYYEAVAYNKRLITNNKLVKELPFYNEEYMQVFDEVEDIDIDWIKKEVIVDYHYNNEFSPVNFLKEVERCTK